MSPASLRSQLVYLVNDLSGLMFPHLQDKDGIPDFPTVLVLTCGDSDDNGHRKMSSPFAMIKLRLFNADCSDLAIDYFSDDESDFDIPEVQQGLEEIGDAPAIFTPMRTLAEYAFDNIAVHQTSRISYRNFI
ncbi:hypothetical protein JTB14_025604 [Gonioctena quinquepunctata]|nr:hypothetical protein JTB14_025604 [Gonioctena quinquepunctata]